MAVTDIYVSDADHSEIGITFGGSFAQNDPNEKNTSAEKCLGSKYNAAVNLPGGYNIYNAVAAVTVARVMGFDTKTSIDALSTFECGFGRMEKFMLEDTETRMILIKNPAGCNQVLNFLSNINSKTLFVVCLNDNYADGTDISWIWDVDFESLQKIEDNLTGVLVSGIRADEMAMRFKYAGIPEEKIKVIKDYEKLIDEFTSQDAPVYIMPTYTAMMDLRAILPTNRTYLSQLINAEYGCNFYQYVTNYRIAEAKRLMREHPELKMQEVAEQSGFASAAVFSRTFSRETGFSPREWSSSVDNS